MKIKLLLPVVCIALLTACNNSSDNKENLIKELEENNIACRPLISGSMGTQPFYKKLYGENKLPKCSIIDERGIYVPNHDKMTKEDIDRVCDILLKY